MYACSYAILPLETTKTLKITELVQAWTNYDNGTSDWVQELTEVDTELESKSVRLRSLVCRTENIIRYPMAIWLFQEAIKSWGVHHGVN